MFFTIKETIKKEEPSGRIRKYCICTCICGNEFTRREDYLKKQDQHVISCGCKNPIRNIGNQSSTWKGVGDLSAQYFQAIKFRARRKHLDFNLTKKYLWKLFEEQKGICALSGVKIELSHSRRDEIEQTASLDRIDSTKGYVKGNVQWVHKTVNAMKNDSSDEEFIKWCQLVSKYSL